jgi:hypothetical protein
VRTYDDVDQKQRWEDALWPYPTLCNSKDLPFGLPRLMVAMLAARHGGWPVFKHLGIYHKFRRWM